MHETLEPPELPIWPFGMPTVMTRGVCRCYLELKNGVQVNLIQLEYTATKRGLSLRTRLGQLLPYEEGESRHVRDFECDFDLRHFASSVVLTSTCPTIHIGKAGLPLHAHSSWQEDAKKI